jgi:group II intron reverse transcriptase/maturase
MAYGKIYRNQGAMTPGSTPETPEGMSLAKIDAIIEAVRYERYRWSPTRRVYIEKKNSTKKRPLSMPTWSDKLLQEVIRLILEAYYEPQFSDTSHGFRPGRGCHTALREIEHWPGTTWFLEGDIKACFDSFDHTVMLDILAENIYDKRFLNLIRRLLQAGYMQEWRYHTTHSGAPQGGIVSPVLSNIYLDKLDKYVEHILKPAYTCGDRRKISKPYMELIHEAGKLRRAGRHKEAQEVRRKAQQMPSVNTTDPNFKRLKYVRYADDWIIGYIGPKEEAEEIKRKVKEYLHDVLKLELSEEKTLITHARTQAARFLSYEITIAQKNTYQTHGERSVNGRIVLRMPSDVLDKKCQAYEESGKPKHRKELTNDTPYSIVMGYQAELRGFAEYYQLALNVHKLWRLKWIMEISLTKTLAVKLKTTVSKVRKRYQTIHTVNGAQYKGLAVIVPRKDKQPLIAKWGGIPFKRNTKAILTDQLTPTWPGRSELEKRLLADTCEVCGSKEQITVHHIRALKDVQTKGRREKPPWMHVMAARRRKTLVVCWACHMSIQHGRPLKLAAKEVKEVKLESRVH